MKYNYSKNIIPNIVIIDGKRPDILIIDVKISNEFGDYIIHKGVIDTGAEVTVVPKYVVNKLNLDKIDDTYINSVNGQTKNERFSSFIEIAGKTFNNFKITAMDIDTVYIGRDLLNLCKIILDSKSKTFTIEPWSTDPKDAYN